MALPDYFHRTAVATAQLLEGWAESAIRERLDGTTVGLTLGPDTDQPEGRALCDLLIRLLTRLYPRLALHGPDDLVHAHQNLARAINPNIEFAPAATALVAISVGSEAEPIAPVQFFAGSDGWDALCTSSPDVPIGGSNNPFGAGAAACLAAARVFRHVFLPEGALQLDPDTTFSTLDLEPHATQRNATIADNLDIGTIALAGVGAIGNAVTWALQRMALRGELHLVDPETIELSNLQRYILTTRADEDAIKVTLAAEQFRPPLHAIAHQQSWDEFVATNGYQWDRVLVALDSAADRRHVQATLPRWIANAWTQPEDLGVSVHPWTDSGACLSCFYLPNGPTPSDDRLIGAALGLGEEHDLRIRQLLHTNEPVPPDLLESIASGLEIPLERLEPFRSRPIRTLYTEGVCGGAVIPLDRIGRPAAAVHVPVAHQSALAGVLLAGRLVADVLARDEARDTTVSRIDLLRPFPEFVTQRAQKDRRGICICQDPDYQSAYKAKYSTPPAKTGTTSSTQPQAN